MQAGSYGGHQLVAKKCFALAWQVRSVSVTGPPFAPRSAAQDQAMIMCKAPSVRVVRWQETCAATAPPNTPQVTMLPTEPAAQAPQLPSTSPSPCLTYPTPQARAQHPPPQTQPPPDTRGRTGPPIPPTMGPNLGGGIWPFGGAPLFRLHSLCAPRRGASARRCCGDDRWGRNSGCRQWGRQGAGGHLHVDW